MACRVLIVDDVPTNRIILKTKLAAACYEVDQAADGTEALARIAEHPPDLVLLDYAMPGLDGIAVCRALRADSRRAELPVIMFTATGDENTRLAALRAGADDFLTKPINDAVLLARMRNLLRMRDRANRLAEFEMEPPGLADPAQGFEAPVRIALIAGDDATASQWSERLAPHLAAAFVTLTPAEAIRGVGPTADLYLVALDLDSPGAGMELVSELRARPDSAEAAICIVVPALAAGTMAVSLDLGADDVLFEDFSGVEAAIRAQGLIARRRSAARRRARMTEHLRLAWIDPLTGLYNRRYGIPALHRMMAEATANGRATTVMLLDLDRFKAVNDRLGHAAGDKVLSEVASRLRAAAGPDDLVVRLGGEEFLVATTAHATMAEAEGMAQHLRLAVSARPVATDKDGSVSVTVSIGLAVREPGGETAEGAVARADEALLGAKAGGRDRVLQIARMPRRCEG